MKINQLWVTLIGILFIAGSATTDSEAQSIEILGGNVLNGAVNGTMLGGATMALQNSDDLAPVRIGLGTGTLYGLAVGVFDLSQATKGQQYYVSGVFNDGDNSSILVLLDTFYGAAGGAIIATSFNLITNEPLKEGLQYGAGIGAWAGFGFGLIDAFVLSERAGDFEEPVSHGVRSTVGGVLTVSDKSAGYRVGFLNPKILQRVNLTSDEFGINRSTGLNLLEVSLRL